jgi:HSP20 family molecular chaperone IbpA
MKLTKYTHNPIAEIERAFDGFFNLTPVFHQLEEVYKTGDQVRFSSDEDGLSVQIDLPGVRKEDLDLSTDTDQREVYIKAKRKVKPMTAKRNKPIIGRSQLEGSLILIRLIFLYVMESLR